MVNNFSKIIIGVLIFCIILKSCYLKKCKRISAIEKAYLYEKFKDSCHEENEIRQIKTDFLEIKKNLKNMEVKNIEDTEKLDTSYNNIINKENVITDAEISKEIRQNKETNNEKTNEKEIKHKETDNEKTNEKEIEHKETDNGKTNNAEIIHNQSHKEDIQQNKINNDNKNTNCNIKLCENKYIKTADESVDIITDLFVLLKKYKLEKTECRKNISNYIENIQKCLLQEKQYGKACKNYNLAIEILKDNLILCKNQKQTNLGECIENIYL
tara:strand:- start:3385 stop:4194 length:810 start_codon:yes stop_codon:yes gene_type:complete